MVYGTLTLVIVPLHRHNNQNVVSPHSSPAHADLTPIAANVSIADPKDCDVCFFSQLTIVFHSSTFSFTAESVKENRTAPFVNVQSFDFLVSQSHRGPPALHS